MLTNLNVCIIVLFVLWFSFCAEAFGWGIRPGILLLLLLLLSLLLLLLIIIIFTEFNDTINIKQPPSSTQYEENLRFPYTPTPFGIVWLIWTDHQIQVK